MLEIDGAHGEGGGQLLRTGVALAALTGMAVRISNIRARRAKSGLAPQHVAAVRAVAELCQGRVDGLALRARQIEFTPGRLRGGVFRFDIGTAGSVEQFLPVRFDSLQLDGKVLVRLVSRQRIRTRPA